MVRKQFTQQLWGRVSSQEIKEFISKGKFPDNTRLSKKEKHNARQVLKQRKVMKKVFNELKRNKL